MTQVRSYKFGTYSETVDGKKWAQSFSQKCDSDAQAELEARNYCAETETDAVYIRRAGAEWYCRA